MGSFRSLDRVRSVISRAEQGLCALAAMLVSATTAYADFPLEGGTRKFVGSDVVNTFTSSGTLVVSEQTTVRALFVAGGGGGGSGVGGGGGGGGVLAFD